MKQFYGRWKFSKKQQAMVWKWKKRKVYAAHENMTEEPQDPYLYGYTRGAQVALRICEEMIADMACVDMQMSLINKREARDVIRTLRAHL
jgi:hypothetical protein